ncbi:MAG: ATP-binding protein [Chitinophagaceae bacterium]|nr:ATP-binding protein [Chitinophagaceae bacterium]
MPSIFLKKEISPLLLNLALKNVVISIKDEGVGMTPEQINNIMADQFIISSANIDNRKGNGLGYLIIKDLIKMMDATLQISSMKNKGTIVSIHVPVGKN